MMYRYPAPLDLQAEGGRAALCGFRSRRSPSRSSSRYLRNWVSTSMKYDRTISAFFVLDIMHIRLKQSGDNKTKL